MKKTLIIVLVILAIVVVALAMNKKEPTVNSSETQATDETTGRELPETVGSLDNKAPSKDENAVAFTVNGGNFYFKPNIIKVKQGDTVTVTFKNDEGFHDFVLNEFNVKTKQVSAGAEQVVTFVADKKGSFEYYCSVGTHRQMGMKGTLVVE
jgi:plastocyanin